MYIAELHGKLSRDQENLEDVLTSNVFSFLKYTPREIFLYSYLSDLGIKISQDDAKRAEFIFWTTFDDRTEPDLVIVVGDYYLLFEAKFFSGFGEGTEDKKAQLVREIEGGLQEAGNRGKEFELIAITADHYLTPDLLKEIPRNLQKYLIWTNWQHFAFFLSSVLETRSDLSDELRGFATDLYSLLDKKKLRKFEGKKALLISDSRIIARDFVYFSGETAKYRGDFIGFHSSLIQSEQVLKNPDTIFFMVINRYFSSMISKSGKIRSTNKALYFQGDKNGK